MNKSFAVDKKTGKVKWQLFSQGGTLRFAVNGREFIRELSPKGSGDIEFEAPSEFEIEILEAPENTFAAFDRRRNYGRSALNGRQIDGEWVMRFSF